jgi:molybdopterin synthase sulfur carrier subunit
MQIHIKLMGALRSKLPAGSQGNKATLELGTQATLANALEKLGLSTGQVHLVMVNGEMDHDKARTLKEGDEVTLFPPVAGGTVPTAPCPPPRHQKTGVWREG